ncbi:MAG TPA: histidine kinase [Streptosporangiaceae bacterium]|nr:histidine kinase [Streptosporangiaceae bacterium]
MHVNRAELSRIPAALAGRRARLRWVYVVLGGALFMPYYLVSLWLIQVAGLPRHTGSQVVVEFAAYFGALPLAALTAPVRFLRPFEVAAAQALLGGGTHSLPGGPARSWRSRGRAGLYYFLHVAGGAVLSGLSFAAVPLAGVLIVLPALGALPRPLVPIWPAGVSAGWAPAAGLVMLLALLCLLAAAGAGATRLATVLLGPTPAERLAEVERRAAALAERGRLARELHDSVGHALSIVAIQANAALRVADHDGEFVKQALTAIGDTAKAAVDELDHVLGLLREEPAGTAPQPTLADLDRLIGNARQAGAKITASVTGDIASMPAMTSREAYRVVQESLTNALRHAGKSPVEVSVVRAPAELTITVANPIQEPPDGRGAGPGGWDAGPGGWDAGPGGTGAAPSGGRGLSGMRERVAMLGGQAECGPQEGDWLVRVAIPL